MASYVLFLLYVFIDFQLVSQTVSRQVPLVEEELPIHHRSTSVSKWCSIFIFLCSVVQTIFWLFVFLSLFHCQSFLNTDLLFGFFKRFLVPDFVFPNVIYLNRRSNTNRNHGATCGANTTYASRAPEFTLGFQWGSYCSIFSFLCRVLQIVVCPFVFLKKFLFWPLYCLFFCLEILIIPLVSSNSSY